MSCIKTVANYGDLLTPIPGAPCQPSFLPRAPDICTWENLNQEELYFCLLAFGTKLQQQSFHVEAVLCCNIKLY